MAKTGGSGVRVAYSTWCGHNNKKNLESSVLIALKKGNESQTPEMSQFGFVSVLEGSESLWRVHTTQTIKRPAKIG
jgi:hypothetical protein